LQRKERKKLKTGILVAIEGIDGAGKTTQAKILRDILVQEGYNVSLFHEPTDGKWGQKIADLAKNGRHNTSPLTEFEFFYFDRKEDVEKHIKPALDRNEIVIMDRYYLSSVSYQGARGLDPDFIEKENMKIAPAPVLTVILDLSPRVALSRIKNMRTSKLNHFEREKYLNKVRKIFLKRFSNRSDVVVVDATRTVDVIASQILNIIKPIVQTYEG